MQGWRAYRRLQLADPSAVPLLLGDISPPPVAVPLHGDLWPGNVAGATVYDPAGYYGHGEADLGMTRMFGGEEWATCGAG